MKTYPLDDNTKEKIEKIIKTELSIKKLYEKIYKLEVNDKKESEEFKTLLEYLNIALEIEKNQIQSLELDFHKSGVLINYLMETKTTKDFLDNVEYITRGEESFEVVRRLLNILIKKHESYHENLTEKLISKEKKEVLKFLGTDTRIDSLSNQIYSNVLVKNNLEIDLYNNFLIFLEEVINNIEYLNYKEELIKTKYNISFINFGIEEELVKTNFSINDTLNIKSKFVANLTGMPEDVYLYLKNSYINKIYNTQVLFILGINDGDYKNLSKVLISILRQCFIRTTFLFMDESELIDKNYEFHEFIECENYRKNSHDNKISEQKIINCFNKTKKDKKKLNEFAFKYKKN